MAITLQNLAYFRTQDPLVHEAFRQVQEHLNLQTAPGAAQPTLVIRSLPHLQRGRSFFGDSRLGETFQQIQQHLNLRVPSGAAKPALSLRELPYLTQRDARLGETFRTLQSYINQNGL